MINSSTSSLTENMAEGLPRRGENPEPIHPLQTSLIPIISSDTQQLPPASETGVLPVVKLDSENQDQNDYQDASLTAEEAKPSPQSALLSPKDSQVPVILIIEDTTELAEVIQATLERINLETVHETHGQRAINLLNEKNPDLVLLDIHLPDMTGWKILDAIKEKHEQRKIQMPIVIVISAYDDPANRLVGKLQGVHSYLIKPFTADEVEQAVVQALRGASK
ncbi:MAG: response regulator [Anaerolineae bacterium]|jgi:CheY-like chemotaxis protein|nr:response regulator [Anaerolineae bacterium]